MKKLNLFVLCAFFCSSLLYGQQDSAISVKPRSFLLGFGFNLGIYNPTGFIDFVQEVADANGLKTSSTMDNINFGLSALAGYRFHKNFDLYALGEYSLSSKDVYSPSESLGGVFHFSDLSGGLLACYTIPIGSQLGIGFGAGALYHHLKIELKDSTVASANTLGPRVQASLDMYSSKKIRGKAILSWDYAKANDNGIEMNYSGVKLGANIIFGL